MIRAILFDLDDTLVDTAALLAPSANREAAAAMVCAGIDAPPGVVERVRAQMERRGGLDGVDLRTAMAFGGDRSVAEAGRRAYFERGSQLRRGDLCLLPGVGGMLDRLRRRYTLMLMTWGDPATQARKVELLRLRRWFEHVVLVDRRGASDKREATRTLLRRLRLRPDETLVVGDSWEREIVAGARLGARTCWIRRSGRRPWPPIQPDAVIANVLGVELVLARIERGKTLGNPP